MIRPTIMCRAAAMAALILPLAVGPPANAQPGSPGLPYEYAVKFVCGTSREGGTAAPGNYFTAINVHNPNSDIPFYYKVALAGSGLERPGERTPFILSRRPLRYDDAIDFDCAVISQILESRHLSPPAFFTGFLVLDTRTEFDVVAVYTASGLTSNEVTSIHTERVPVRRLQR